MSENRFAGEYTDAETGFVYLRARYYDPATGQFLSRDPIEAITRSPYAYVHGNPLNYTDPLGLLSLKGVLRGASLIAGGVAIGVGVTGLIVGAPITVAVGGTAVGVAAALGGVSFFAGAGAAALQCRETGFSSTNCIRELAGTAVDLVSLGLGLAAVRQSIQLGKYIPVAADIVGLVPDAASYHIDIARSGAWISHGTNRC